MRMRFSNANAVFFLALLIVAGCRGGFDVDDLLSNNPRERGEALAELIRLPDETVQEIIPVLTKTLDHPDPRRVDYATDALSVIGEPAVPAIRRELGNKEVFARISAARVLGLLGDASTPAVPDLIRLAESDAHPLVRDEAIQSLGYIGPAAKEALPLLKQLKTSDNEDIRVAASAAINQISR